jgi:hypothetical protein
MNEGSKWSGLSDEQFVEILLQHAIDKSWTVGEIIELERRGFEILDGHPEVQNELRDRRDKFIEKILDATKPALDGIKKLQSSINLFQKPLSKFSFPTFEVPTLNIQSITGPVAPKIANSNFVRSSENGSLKDLAIHRTLEKIAEATEVIAKYSKPGWNYWALFVFSAISAVGVILGFIIG